MVPWGAKVTVSPLSGCISLAVATVDLGDSHPGNPIRLLKGSNQWLTSVTVPDRYPGFFTCPTTRSIKIVCPTGIEFSKSSEAFPHAAKNCDRLAVWKSQSENFSRLAIVGKYILGIPASSATSERFFSAAGRTVTSDQCSLSVRGDG